MKKQTNSALQTQKLAYEFAQKINGYNLICLYGDLGSGKTTFVQGFAKGLGISKRVTSPTFVIAKEYLFQARKLIHIDCYRIESLSLREFLEDQSNLVVIEWPERIKLALPKKRIDIQFNYLDDLRREIEIKLR